MADIEASGPIPVSEIDDEFMSFIYYYKIVHFIQLGITLATFMYGVISWCLIKKFRTFNNYVYLNVVLVNLLRLIVVMLPLMYNVYIAVFLRHEDLHFFIYAFLFTVLNYWLIVMCYMFYVDIVKLFSRDVKRRHLYSFLFGWGVPSVLTGITRLVIFIVERKEDNSEDFVENFGDIFYFVTSSVLPAMINLVLFIKLLFSLFPCDNTIACAMDKKARRKQKLSRLCTAMAMFVVSNTFMLMMLVWDFLEVKILIRAITINVQILFLALFFPLIKSNRVYWHEYLKSRLKRPFRDYYCCIVCR